MAKKEYEIVDGVEKLEAALERVRAAQRKMATFTQEQVDRIFLAAATAANRARIDLAEQAVAETGMGIVEDKVIKNHYASEYIYNKYRNTKTCGVLEEDKSDSRAYRRYRCGNTYYQSYFHCDIQVSYRAEDQKRYHHQPSPTCKGEHHSSSKGCT